MNSVVDKGREMRRRLWFVSDPRARTGFSYLPTCGELVLSHQLAVTAFANQDNFQSGYDYKDQTI